MKRREFLSLSLKVSAAFASIAAAPIAVAYQCAVVRQQITLAGLPRAFDGFRVALLSDLHHSPWIPARHIRSAVELANAERPDLIALTGDFIHQGKEWAPACMAELAKLRGRQGVVAVLGNHDHYGKAADTVRQGLRMAKITDLTNACIPIQHEGATFLVGGVGDLWKERQKLHQALGNARRAESTLLLSHNPDYVEQIDDERVGLTLSGHTHGGQCVFPLVGAPWIPSRFGQKYLYGLCRGPVARVFVTRGVGASFPPVRFRCPAEIAVLTLRAPARMKG